ncbi:MAG: hypothetical protein MHPSP_003450, partial [Paramarteilia canceri]
KFKQSLGLIKQMKCCTIKEGFLLRLSMGINSTVMGQKKYPNGYAYVFHTNLYYKENLMRLNRNKLT